MKTPRTPSHAVNPKRAFSTKNTIPVTDFDVRCGKDRSNLGHMGNKRFQAIITLNIPRYKRAGKKRGIKSNIVKAVLKDVRSLGSRFFHKKGKDWIQVVDDRIMYDKVGHALRDSFCSSDTVVQAEAFMNMNGFEYDNDAHDTEIAVTLSTVPCAPFSAVDDYDGDGDGDEVDGYFPLLFLDDPSDMFHLIVHPEALSLRRQSWKDGSSSEPCRLRSGYDIVDCWSPTWSSGP